MWQKLHFIFSKRFCCSIGFNLNKKKLLFSSSSIILQLILSKIIRVFLFSPNGELQAYCYQNQLHRLKCFYYFSLLHLYYHNIRSQDFVFFFLNDTYDCMVYSTKLKFDLILIPKRTNKLNYLTQG